MSKYKEIASLIKTGMLHGNPPPYKGGPGAGPSTNNIGQMQTHLKDVIATIQKNGISTKGVQDQAATRAFNNFIVGAYANKATHGYERDAGTSKESDVDDPREQLHTINKVMESLNYTGSQPNEAMQDGIWDWRTNNALKNAYAYTTAVAAATTALGINSNSQSIDTDLQVLRSNMLQTVPDKPKEVVKTNDTQDRAKKIDEVLPRIDAFLKQVLQAIFLDKDNLVPYFDGNKALSSFDRPQNATAQRAKMQAVEKTRSQVADLTDVVTEDRGTANYWNIKLDPPIQVKSNAGSGRSGPSDNRTYLSQVHTFDLLNMDNFKQYLSKNNVPNDNATVAKVLKVMQTTLDATAK